MTGYDMWTRNDNKFKRLLEAGEPAVAVWVNVPWLGIPEILGSVGCDAALIDMEHTSNSIRDVQDMIIACTAAGITPFYRPAGINGADVSRALDSGAQGIIFPHIDTQAEAERAVACTKWPPLGNRAWGGAHTRQALWDGVPGAAALAMEDERARGSSSMEYVNKINSEIHVSLMIESPEGVANIEDILEVPGIDSVRLGWGDYSVSVGFDLDECRRASDRIYQACAARKIGVSFTMGRAMDHQPHYPGCWYGAGVDALIFAQSLRDTVREARAHLGRQ